MEESKKVTDLTKEELLQDIQLYEEKISAEYKVISAYKAKKEECIREVLKRFGGELYGLFRFN